MSALFSKVAALRFLKKMVIFCVVYIVIFTVANYIIYCIKGEYPEHLCTLTFAYFSIEVVISAGIRIFETFKKRSKFDLPKTEDDPYLNYTPGKGEIYPETEEKETEHYGHN